MSEALFAEWAPRYAARGIHVFPCLAGAKEPLTKHGFLDASIDPEQIALWSRQFPDANIAIYPGPSKLLGLDVDLYKSGAPEAWNNLLTAVPELNEPTLMVKTARGGVHRYYSMPEGMVVGKSEGKLGPGIDTRNADGYLVLPPSRFQGGTYEWVNAGTPIATAPLKLVELLQAARKQNNAKLAEDGAKIHSGDGKRYIFLWGRACGMRSNGDDEASIYEALSVLNQNRLEPPKPDDIVRKIAHDVATRYSPGWSEDLVAAQRKARTDWSDRKSPEPKKNGLKKYKLTKFSEIEEREVDWLMPGYIAKGKFSLCWGMEGRGKSFASIGIASMITRGEALPGVEMAMGATPGNVLLVTYEDDPHDTIKPRLRMNNADMDRVYTVHYDEGSVNWRNVDALIAAIEDIPDLRLVVIDPVTAYAIGINENTEIEVREALDPLIKLAFKRQFALVGIKHPNKDSDKPIDDRVGGSRGWTAVARAAFLVGHDNLKENTFGHTYGGMRPTKGNLVSQYPPQTYEIDNGVFRFTGSDPTMTSTRLMPKKVKDDE